MKEATKILLSHFGCRTKDELCVKYHINFTIIDIIVNAMEAYHNESNAHEQNELKDNKHETP